MSFNPAHPLTNPNNPVQPNPPPVTITPDPAAPGKQNGRTFTTLEKVKHITLVALPILAAVGCLMLFPLLEGPALIAACAVGTLCAIGAGIYYATNAAFFITMPTFPEKKEQ